MCLPRLHANVLNPGRGCKPANPSQYRRFKAMPSWRNITIDVSSIFKHSRKVAGYAYRRRLFFAAARLKLFALNIVQDSARIAACDVQISNAYLLCLELYRCHSAEECLYPGLRGEVH